MRISMNDVYLRNAVYFVPFAFYPRPWWFDVRGRRLCPPPVIHGCRTLNITWQWATTCFVHSYRWARTTTDKPAEIVEMILSGPEIPKCGMTPAVVEFRRRVTLAVDQRLAYEARLAGSSVPRIVFVNPAEDRPELAQSIQQPWLRMLMTGWV